MADDNDLELKIGADGSGVAAGLEPVKAEITDFAQLAEFLTGVFEGMGEAIREAMQAPEGSGGLKSEMQAVEAETEKEVGLLKEMALNVHEGVEGFNDFKSKLMEVGEVYLAAFAVERIIDWAKEMGEASVQVERMTVLLGATNQQIAQLSAVAAMANTSTEALATSASRVGRAMEEARQGGQTQINLFHDMGIAIDGTQSPLELLQETLQKLGDFDPVSRNAMAMQLLGRNIQELAPLLGMTKEQWDEASDAVAKYGLNNQNALAASRAIDEAFDENSLALKGLAALMTENLAPTLTILVKGFNDLAAAFIASANNGGQAKDVLDALSETMRLLAAFLITVGEVAIQVFEGLNMAAELFGGAFDGMIDLVIGYSNSFIEVLKTMAVVLNDVFITHNWGQVASDWGTGMKAATDAASQGWSKYTTDTNKAASNIAASFGVMKDSAFAYHDTMDKLFYNLADPMKMPGAAGTDKPPVRPPKAPAEKSQMSGFEAEFAEQEEAWEAAHEGMLRNVQAAELDFWNNIAATRSMSAKDSEDVEKKRSDLIRQLRTQDIQFELQAAQTEAQNDAQAIQSRLQAGMAANQADIRDTQTAADQHQISRAQELTQIQGLLGEQVAMQQAAADQILQIRIGLDTAIMSHYDEDTKEYQKALNDQEKAFQAHADTLNTIATKSATDQSNIQRKVTQDATRDWASMISPIVNNFGSFTSSLIAGTSTFSQAWSRLGEGMLNTFVGWTEKMAINWLSAEFAKTTATAVGTTTRVATETAGAVTGDSISATSAIIRIGHQAAVAAAGAWAALAGIPIIGPILAPAAAIAALAGVIALGRSIFSAEDGWGNVPYDGATTELHKEEMVLPATIARPMRSMLASMDGSSGPTAAGLAAGMSGASPGGGRATQEGDVHFSVTALDANSVKRFFQKNGDSLGDSLRRQARNLKGGK